MEQSRTCSGAAEGTSEVGLAVVLCFKAPLILRKEIPDTRQSAFKVRAKSICQSGRWFQEVNRGFFFAHEDVDVSCEDNLFVG